MVLYTVKGGFENSRVPAVIMPHIDVSLVVCDKILTSTFWGSYYIECMQLMMGLVSALHVSVCVHTYFCCN